MAATVRKEISKDDYKFFIGRVEKISNGQVEFIADTQKKAVELLGEKIPQNVIDAANNYKAFNIWLGNAVNPIIVSDSGYKEEIRVFGDGYDFFEVKAETGNTEFKYYLKSDRPLFGAVPSGYVHAEKFENAVRVPRHGYIFGTVIYGKSLTDEQVRIYDLKPDKNNPKSGGNAAAVSEVSSSIDNIFAAVTAEIKPNIRGKYFVQIDDNWYQQSVKGNFATLEDAVKIARIMHSELCKVSRHIYATVEARTVDISKYCFRADDWTTFFEIDNYGNEKVLRRETVEAIAKIENRTVEEVRNDIGRCADNYGIYKNSVAEVENILDEIDNGKYAIESIESRIEKLTSEFNEVKDTAEQSKAKEIQFLIDCANEEIDFAKKRIADAMKEIERKNIDGAKAEVAGMIERIEYAEETFDRANSVLAEVEKINAEKNSLKAKVAEIERNDMAIKVQQIDAYIRSNSNRIKNLNAAIGGFKADLDYQAEYFEEMLKENDERGMFSTARTIKNQLNHIAELEKEIADLEKRIKALKAERVQYTDKKAKVAEILNRPRKSVIDWKATFDDMQVSEILNLQKDLKKFLKLGQIDLAENIFSMLKTLCKNYRAVAA